MPTASPYPDVLSTASVLIVDDQEANVALLTRLIRAAGIGQVHAVTDPRQAIARCLEVGADLVLLDWHMPGMDGLSVLTSLQTALPEDMFVPVIVLTADTTTAARDEALRAGAKDFLTKPFDHAEVVLRVRNMLETRALYAEVQSRNAVLQSALADRVEADRRRAEERRERTERIDDALSGDALTMVFQPVVDLGTGDIIGFEALSRFLKEPRRPPNEWFDEAASVGLGAELELASVQAALAQFHLLPADAFLTLNISPSTALLDDLCRLIDRFPAQRIVLEVTEHAPVEDYAALLGALACLRDRGMRIAVDDAGAGHSGLRHILQLRPDIIKLDIDLTRNVDTDPARRALATALVTFAAEIDAIIIAEGIETPEELSTLRALGIPWGQGYHLGRPATLAGPTRSLTAHDAEVDFQGASPA